MRRVSDIDRTLRDLEERTRQAMDDYRDSDIALYLIFGLSAFIALGLLAIIAVSGM